MMTVLIVFTLFCFFVPVYVYFGYPALLWVLTRLGFRRPVVHGEALPTVTLIVSCYNERQVIRDKLNNALALDYPRGRLKVCVVSDASDDGTDEIAREYADQAVVLVRQEERMGKTMGLNRALEGIDTDIVVFSDANAIYEPDAIRRLVRNFSDPSVGYVVGAALYTDETETDSGRNEDLYWRYELAIKRWESELHSVVGGDGAIYAIRRSLWQPLQIQDINDFVNPLQIVASGYRGVFEPQARCYEETAGTFAREAARKERIVNRSFRGLLRVKSVLNPVKSGFFAFEVISHKLLRWLIPFFLLGMLAGCAWLSVLGGTLFQLPLAGAIVLLALASVGALLESRGTSRFLFSTPYYFVLVNLYSMRGIIAALQGKTQVTWNSARPGSAKAGPEGIRPFSWLLGSTGLLMVSLIWPYLA